MTIQAIAYRLVIKPDPIETKTASGIVIASDEELEKGARFTGTIVSIGPDVYNNSILAYAGLKIGDRIYYAKYAGKVIKDKTTGEEFVVLNDEDVVAKDASSSE